MQIARGLMALCAALCLTGAARAQGVEQFYRGRTVQLLIPTSPGGNYDLNSRLVSRHLGRFIPGNPTVVPQNIPGAGGMLVAQRLANTVDRDGATIAILERGTPQLAYEGDANAKYDPLKFNWLGSLSSYADDAYLVLIMARHPAKTLEDLRKSTVALRLGGDKPGSTNLTFAILARDLLKLPIQVVKGYNGGAPMFLAMQSGELDGQVIGMGSARGAQPALSVAEKAADGATWTSPWPAGVTAIVQVVPEQLTEATVPFVAAKSSVAALEARRASFPVRVNRIEAPVVGSPCVAACAASSAGSL